MHRVLKPGGRGSSHSAPVKTLPTKVKHPMLDKYTLINMEEGPEEGEPHFYADEEILYELEPLLLLAKPYAHPS